MHDTITTLGDEYKYYDQGIAAREADQPYNKLASLAWRDGWKDQDQIIRGKM